MNRRESSDEEHEFASPQDSVYRKHRNWTTAIFLVSNIVLFLISVVLFSEARRDRTCKNETETGYSKSSPNHTYPISDQLTQTSSPLASRLRQPKNNFARWDFLEQYLHLPPRSIPRSRRRMVAHRGDIYHHSTLIRDPLSRQRPSQDCQSTRKLGSRRRCISSGVRTTEFLEFFVLLS
jgi:hypothetical protein